MKKVIIILGLLLLLVIIGVVAVALSLDRIVKAGVESVAPGITQTTVTLDSVHLSLFSGSAKLKGLVIGSPEGYKAPNLMSLGLASVSLQPASLSADKIVIHSIEVRAPEITFEGNPLGDNNLKKLLANVNSQAAASATTTNAPGAKAPAKKLQVDDFLIAGAKVHALISTPLLTKELSLTLPDIHLSNLGQGPDGITPAELTQQVIGQITSATITSLGSSLNGLGKDLLNGATKAPADTLKKLGNGLGGLLPK